MSEERKTARVILINSDDEILLVKYVNPEPLNAMRPDVLAYWVPPGGGVEEGETFEEAARREIREETGQTITVGPCIWRRELDLKLSGKHRLVKERYFVARCSEKRVDSSGHADDDIVAYRWWDIEAMHRTSETLLPPGLVGLLSPVLQGEYPNTPINIGDRH